MNTTEKIKVLEERLQKLSSSEKENYGVCRKSRREMRPAFHTFKDPCRTRVSDLWVFSPSHINVHEACGSVPANAFMASTKSSSVRVEFKYGISIRPVATSKNPMRLIVPWRIYSNYKMTDLEDIIQYFSDEEVSKYENFYLMSEEQVRNIRICRYFTPFLEKCTHCLKFEVQYIF